MSRQSKYVDIGDGVRFAITNSEMVEPLHEWAKANAGGHSLTKPALEHKEKIWHFKIGRHVANDFADEVERLEKELRGPAPKGPRDSFNHFLREASRADAGNDFLENLRGLVGGDSIRDMLDRLRRNSGLQDR